MGVTSDWISEQTVGPGSLIAPTVVAEDREQLERLAVEVIPQFS